MKNPFEIEEKNDITVLSEKVIMMENSLKEFKKMEENLKIAKEELRNKMLDSGIKTWELKNGTKITAIEDTPSKEKKVINFCEGLLKNEMPEIYEKYLREQIEVTSPRKGSLRITFPKGE